MGSSSTSSDHQLQPKQLLSKIATSKGHGEDSSYFEGWKAYDKDPYHATHNPEGVIQMDLAENQLCFDLIEEWIKNNPQASICTKEGVQQFMGIANFQDYHGMPAFREAVAKFMGKARGGRVRFNPDRIVMGGGSTGANEIITFCLADPGDAFLVPSPYYPAFDQDLRWRTGVQLFPVICESSNGFKISKVALEEAYEKIQKANINLKGLLITNPSNPLGTTLDKEGLKTIVSFINSKNIHLVCDEIYAATVFNQPKFTSIAEIIEEDGDCNKDLIHIVYSLSKDMGFPGFRVGIVYSYNDKVVNCARKMSSFGLVSTQTQHLIATMLSDDVFVERFLVESPNRLAKRYNFIRSELSKVEIECLDSNAGLFCWMDLRKLLKEPTLEEEMRICRVIVHEAKLNVSPGSSFHCLEPGWFRVCFANMDDETMEVALKRMQKFVVAPVIRNKRSKSNLRVSLSFKSRRMEEYSLMSPCTMSPHSPLVSART